MTKTEQALAAIFRHCDEVAEGKRQPRGDEEGREIARAWLGNVKTVATEGAGESPTEAAQPSSQK